MITLATLLDDCFGKGLAFYKHGRMAGSSVRSTSLDFGYQPSLGKRPPRQFFRRTGLRLERLEQGAHPSSVLGDMALTASSTSFTLIRNPLPPNFDHPHLSISQTHWGHSHLTGATVIPPLTRRATANAVENGLGPFSGGANYSGEAVHWASCSLIWGSSWVLGFLFDLQ